MYMLEVIYLRRPFGFTGFTTNCPEFTSVVFSHLPENKFAFTGFTGFTSVVFSHLPETKFVFSGFTSVVFGRIYWIYHTQNAFTTFTFVAHKYLATPPLCVLGRGKVGVGIKFSRAMASIWEPSGGTSF